MQKLFRTRIMVLSTVLLLMPAIAAGESQLQEEQFTLVQMKGTDEWELRNRNGDLLGLVKSREKGTFKIYDRSGNYKGFVYESEKWVPRDARQKRELKISIDDVVLYLSILKAVESSAAAPRNLTLRSREGAVGEWDLLDASEQVAGRVVKDENGFKFYDSGDKLMGFLYTSGEWMPKLGINRREMRITPKEAQFCLDVYRALKNM